MYKNPDNLLEFLKLVMLIFGLVFNLLFLLLIIKNKTTKSFKSYKPFRHLLAAMVISDLWFLVDKIYEWYVSFVKFNFDPLSFNGACQFYSYLDNFFSILLEFYMLTANYILFCIIFKSKKTADLNEIYNKYIPDQDSGILIESKFDKLRTNYKKWNSSSLRVLSANISLHSLRATFNTKKKTEASNLDENVVELGSSDKNATSLEMASEAETHLYDSVENNNSCKKNKRANFETTFSDFAISNNDSDKLDLSKAKSMSIEKLNTISITDSSLKHTQPNIRKSTLFNSTASFSSKFFSNSKFNFLDMVQNERFEKENFYFNIILIEKISIILFIFVWIYLLSFLLWVRGVHVSSSPKTDIESASKFLDSLSKQLQPPDFSAEMSNSTPLWDSSYFVSESSEELTTQAPQDADYTSITPQTTNICMTHKFAKPFYNIFRFVFSLFRLFTLLSNIFISVAYHFKFRKECLQTLLSTFQKKTFNFDFKTIKFKNFNLFYTTKPFLNYDIEDEFLNTKLNTRGPYEFAKYTSKADLLKKTQLHYMHIQFIRHYAIMVFIYSILIISSVLKDIRYQINEMSQTQSIESSQFGAANSTFFDPNQKNPIASFSSSSKLSLSFISPASHNSNTNENDLNTIKKFLKNAFKLESSSNKYYEFYIYVTEVLAHSCKFLVYVVFSLHIKCFVKYYKNSKSNDSNLLNNHKKMSLV